MDTKDNKNTQSISDEEPDKNSGRKLDDEDLNHKKHLKIQ